MVYPRDPYWGLFNILGPFYMFFEQKDVKFAAYADDNTSYFCDKNSEILTSH